MDDSYSYFKNDKCEVESKTFETGFEISDSKAKLIYRNFVEKRTSSTFLSIFASLFASFLITLFTAEFKNIFGIEGSSYMIFGIFVFLCACFGVGTIISVLFVIRNHKKFNENAFIKSLHSDGIEFEIVRNSNKKNNESEKEV